MDLRIGMGLDEYLKNRPEEQVNKLKKYIAKGQIELHPCISICRDCGRKAQDFPPSPSKEFRKHGIPSTLAMQNDVNGIVVVSGRYLPDLEIKYLWMGEHHYKSQVPFNMPTVFQWESPSGKPDSDSDRADHYNTGNFWGIEQGDIQKTEPKLLHYLSELGVKCYPFDAVGTNTPVISRIIHRPPSLNANSSREWE